MKKSTKISKSEAIYVMILLILILVLLLFLLLRKIIQNFFTKRVKEFSLDELLGEDTKELENTRNQKKTNNKANKKPKANTVITKGNHIISKSVSKDNPKPLKPLDDLNTQNAINEDVNENWKKNKSDANSSFSINKEKFKSIELREIEYCKPDINRSIYEIAENEIKLKNNSLMGNSVLYLDGFQVEKKISDDFKENEKNKSFNEKDNASANLDNNDKMNSFIEKSFFSEKENKLDLLTKEEIEAFDCLLGLLYYNIDVKRKYKVTSVESIYELKLKNDCFAYKADDSFNVDFSKKLAYMETYENFIEIINLYCASIKKKVLVTLENYHELVKCCFKVKEMNFAIFFLCEIEIKYGCIKKNVIDNIINNPALKLILCGKIVKNPRFKQSSNKKKKDSINLPYSNVNLFDSGVDLEHNLILPLNNNFRQNPEYFFFKTKRENFRNQNLLNKLDTLGIKLIEEEIIEEINHKKNEHKEVVDKGSSKYDREANYKNEAAINNMNKNEHRCDEKTINAENLTITDRIKMIIQGNVKEYMPKTFKIIVKENKND